MKFVLVPPGDFSMGSTPAEVELALKVTGDDRGWPEKLRGEIPKHRVVLTRGYYLGCHEVTQREYAAIMTMNPAHFSGAGPGDDLVTNADMKDFPVEEVSWNDAAEFCAKLSVNEELKPFYFRTAESVIAMSGTGYRLPSEAEWEFACRAGTTTKYWIGDRDEDLLSAAWFAANSSRRTHRVGELNGNPWGLFDVHGNVWEWVGDGWDPKSFEKTGNEISVDPMVSMSDAGERSIRGGDWSYSSTYSRSAIRHFHDPTHKDNNLGFRVSLQVDSVRSMLK